MSTPRIHSRQASAGQRQRQRGVYALEWAIIFSAFFMLLYAIVSFGLGFLVRESMQGAGEDGARASLRYQENREIRKQEALQVIKNNLSWLPATLVNTISQQGNFSFKICRLDTDQCTEDTSAQAIECDAERRLPCMVQVRLSLPYARHAFTPSLSMGLMEIALPDLQAESQILVDQARF